MGPIDTPPKISFPYRLSFCFDVGSSSCSDAETGLHGRRFSFFRTAFGDSSSGSRDIRLQGGTFLRSIAHPCFTVDIWLQIAAGCQYPCRGALCLTPLQPIHSSPATARPAFVCHEALSTRPFRGHITRHITRPRHMVKAGHLSHLAASG